MEKSKKLTVKDICFAGMFAALTAVMSQIQIPMPSGVPVTLQTFAVALAGYVLGARLGTVATAVYVLIGAAGVPVFSGFKGGVGAITGITGGFIWGFIIMAFLCGLGKDSGRRELSVLFGAAGVIMLHLCGALQFTAIRQGSLWQSLMLVSFPFLFKDILSVLAAITLEKTLRKRLGNIIST